MTYGRATSPATTLRRGVDLSPTDSIRLSVPAASAAVRIARAAAAGLATRAGFTYHEVEQLQLAVGEASALLAPDPDGDGTLVLVFDIERGGMRIDLHLVDPGESAHARRVTAVPSVAEAVLDSAVDDWRVQDGGYRVVLHKTVSDTDDEDDD
jgi:hypothetical protein